MKTVGATATARGIRWDGASSPPESVDETTYVLDGSYDAFIEQKKIASVSWVPSFIYLFHLCVLLLTHGIF